MQTPTVSFPPSVGSAGSGLPRGTLPAPALNRNVGLFTDSKGALSFYNDGSNLIAKCFGLATWLQSSSLGRIAAPVSTNRGITGQTSAEILARQKAVLAELPDVDVWVVICGSNDRRAAMTLEQSKRNVRAICQNFLNAGRYVVVISETPNGDGAAVLTDAQQAIHYAYHLWCRDVLATEVPGVLVANPWEDMEDTSTPRRNPLPGMTKDGVHFTKQGAEIVGRHTWNAMPHLFPGSHNWFRTNDHYDASRLQIGSLNLNPALLYSGGSINANIPLGGGVTAGSNKAEVAGNMQLFGDQAGPVGAIVTPSLEVDADGVTWQKLAVTGRVAAAASKEIIVRTSSPLANMAANDVIKGMMRVKHRGVGLASVSLDLLLSRNTDNKFFRVYSDNEAHDYIEPSPTRLVEGSRETPVYTHNQGAEDITFRVNTTCCSDVDLNFEIWFTSIAVTKIIV